MGERMSKMTANDQSLASECTQIVTRLKELNINFLAVDFDLTMIDVHTGGVWKSTAPELATHVRPIFKQLIEEAVVVGDVKVAVVTFSPQVGHIAEVLRIAFPEIYHNIPIRGRDRSWSYHGGGSREGKQSFMASAAEELHAKYPGENFTKNTTLLIDDDPNNIKIALQDGVRAIWINPDKPQELIQNLRKLV